MDMIGGIAIVAIICSTILYGMYMTYCYENEVGIFEDKTVTELKEEIRQLKEGKT